MYGELMVEIGERGGEVLTPLIVVFTKVVSHPLISPGSFGGPEAEGDRIPPLPFAHTSNVRREQNLLTLRHWLVLLLSRRIAGPSSGPGQDWIQTSPSNSLSPVCLLFGRTDGQTNRHLRLVPRKARWIYKD